MSRTNKRRLNTRLQIIQLAAHLFIVEGYTQTTITKLAKLLDLSTGNITFYFPTKEDMLAVLAEELCDFQRIALEQKTKEEQSSLLAYCLEMTSIAAICAEDEVAKDFYAACYRSQQVLELIRENDTEKTKEIFSQYRPQWDQTQWVATENLVSGIEYATIMTKEETTPLSLQIEKALDNILYLYGVPEDKRRENIQKVLSMDCRGIGREILQSFREYIERVNEENLKNATGKRRRRKQ